MIAIVGGGPAGLRAAEVAAARGAEVTVFDAKASVGRKFLVAGGGGLNLTREEPVARFASRYRGPEMPEKFWARRIAEFGPLQLREWSAGLGIETFVASTGRVYPEEMKAAPLLRRWVQRLRSNGVRFAMHHRWIGFRDGVLAFETPRGPVEIRADATILAMGGGSWPETGSDGAWCDVLAGCGVAVAPMTAANCGWEVDWAAGVLEDAEGEPLKNVAVRAGNEEVRGELIVTRYGLEGGAIYALGAALRELEQPEITIDFKPDVEVARLVARFGTVGKATDETKLVPPERWDALVREAASRWRLDAGAAAILRHHAPAVATVEALARAVKDCRISLTRPRPLAEAISSAGGVRWPELDHALMIKRLPGVFVAGEMIDWEAPTGGYLMQGCFATGTHAARGALSQLALI